MTTVSVIVPTHNRRDLLRQLLHALSSQAADTPPFEVIIVADGCHDDTSTLVRESNVPFAVSLLELPGLGPALARNAGAKVAKSKILLFLDDDVIPTSGLVKAHVEAHLDKSGGVVLGPYPPVPLPAPDHFRQKMQQWWSVHFARLAEPGHRFSYLDLLTGNLSIPKAVWDALDGLDPQFARAREDLEFGVRLIKAGIAFHYAPEALAFHYEHLTTNQLAALHRKKEEGRSDALMLAKHPEMAACLQADRISRRQGLLRSGINKLLRRAGAFDDTIAAKGVRIVRGLERLGFLASRNRLERALNRYFYTRGAVEGLAVMKPPFRPMPYPHQEPSSVDLDLGMGLEAAEAILSGSRPQRARVVFGQNEVGELPFMPMAEPWDGRHLRQHLATVGARRLIPYLAAKCEGGNVEDWRLADGPSWIGRHGYWSQVHENQRQWKNLD